MTEEITCLSSRVSQVLIVPHPSPEPPKIGYDTRPPGLFRLIGDGVTSADWDEVRAAAAELRAQCDATGGDWWVWVGHNQFLYCTEWQFYQCFGPLNWASARHVASERSFAAVYKMQADKDAAEKKAGQIRAAASREANRGKRGKKKKVYRNMDAIAEQLGESEN